MQKVKFEAPTGAELRQQMLDFLGLDGTNTIRQEGLAVTHSRIVELAKSAVNDPLPTPTPEPETPTQEAVPETTTTTRKRRSKAEIEADKAPETPVEKTEEELNAEATGSESTEDTPADDTGMTETLAQDNAEANKETKPAESEITRPFLTEIVLAKGREGKKPLMLAIFADFVQADGTTKVSGLPNLDPKDYEAFYAKVKDL